MESEASDYRGPVTALCCADATVLFAVGNAVYEAASPSSCLIGRVPDGCAVTSIVSCSSASLVVVSSADTLFWHRRGETCEFHRLCSAEGARLIKVVFDAALRCLFIIASNGLISIVPVEHSAEATPSTSLSLSSHMLSVRAFDAGVLLAGDVLVCPNRKTGVTQLLFFAATYAGTVLEYRLDVRTPAVSSSPSLSTSTNAVFADALRRPAYQGTLVAHRPGCAIFAVASLYVNACEDESTSNASVCLATCSDDRSVALFWRPQNDGATSPWQLRQRFSSTTFSRCRVFDVCLSRLDNAAGSEPVSVLCGVAGEDGTVQVHAVPIADKHGNLAGGRSHASVQPLEQSAASTVLLYRPLQHSGHGAWRVGFTPFDRHTRRCGKTPALVSAGFDGTVVQHPVLVPDQMRMRLATMGLQLGTRQKLQVRCVAATEKGLIVSCTERELIVAPHHGCSSAGAKTVNLFTSRSPETPPGNVMSVRLSDGDAHSAPPYLPTVVAGLTVSPIDVTRSDTQLLIVIGTDRGACVLVCLSQTHGEAWQAGPIRVCTTLVQHQKWLAMSAVSEPSPRLASCHLDGSIVVSRVSAVNAAAGDYTLQPLYQCVSGPGRSLTALQLVSRESFRDPAHAKTDNEAVWLVLCGDKAGNVCSYTLPSRHVEADEGREVSRVEPTVSARLFADAQTVCVFASHDASSPTPEIITVFASDGLSTHLSVRDCVKGIADHRALPLRFPAKLTRVLAASTNVVVAQHATTVSVYRRDGAGSRCDWTQVALYESVKAPRLLAATISSVGVDENVYIVHCSDGETIESYDCGALKRPVCICDVPEVRCERSDSLVLHGASIAGKDFNACLFIGSPSNTLLCAGEDTGLLILDADKGARHAHCAVTLYGPHHSNILALCELPVAAYTNNADASAVRHRVVTVGGLATVTLWQWTAEAHWCTTCVVTEEDTGDKMNADRIPRFLSVRAVDADSFMVGASDGTVRFFTVTQSGYCMRLNYMRTLNPDCPKPILTLTSVVPSALSPSDAVHARGTLIAGDTNGNVYVFEAGDATAHVDTLRVEHSAVNALGDAHVVTTHVNDNVQYHIRFVSVHDSGTAHMIGGVIGSGQLAALNSISTGITAGRGAVWLSRDGPITVVSEEWIVRALWQETDRAFVELGRRRPNVRCVSGLSERGTSPGSASMLAVVGQGVETVATP